MHVFRSFLFVADCSVLYYLEIEDCLLKLLSRAKGYEILMAPYYIAKWLSLLIVLIDTVISNKLILKFTAHFTVGVFIFDRWKTVPPIEYMCHIFFIHSSVDGHLGCLYVLAIVNRAAMNMVAHDSFWIMVFSGYMPRTGIKTQTY